MKWECSSECKILSDSNVCTTSTKLHLKMNKEIGMILPKKRVNTSGVGESNNYYEDIYNIYIPPYNNTH